MLTEIIDYIKQHKRLYVIVFITLLLDYGLAIVPTQIVQFLINQMTSQTLTQHHAIMQLGMLIVVALLAYVSAVVWCYYLFKQTSQYRYELRMNMFQKMIRMKIPYFEKFRSGDMMTRFTSDIGDLSELLGYGSMSLLIALATMLFVIPTMFMISWMISILAIIPIVLLGIFVFFVGDYQDKAVEESRNAVAALSDEVLEVVEGIRVTRAYGKKELGSKRFKEKTANLVKKADKIMVYQASYGRLAMLFMSISTAIIIGLGALQLEEGTITLGGIVALQLYSLVLMEPMWVLSDFILVYQTAHIAHGKIKEVLTQTDDMEPDGQQKLETIHHIEMNQYSFAYANSSFNQLNSISIRLEKGQTLGIVGKTGSGKTTLIRQFLRQYPIGNGTFSINGLPVERYQRNSIESKIGYVPQEHVLFSKSVKENIQLGKIDATNQDVLDAIEAASFSEDITRMENGWDTLVGEKGVSISGGQKQRISIARAFIKEPELLILDDSLSAVDARTERNIIRMIQSVRQGKTNIIVTHRLSAVQHADWIVVLDEGSIVEEGTPQQLLEAKGWYFEQYEKQQLEGGEE